MSDYIAKRTSLIAEHTESGEERIIYLHENCEFGLDLDVESEKIKEEYLDIPSEYKIYPRITFGSKYSLWKDGRKYIVYAITYNEKNEPSVFYQALYGDRQYYLRPYDIFVSEVDIGREDDNKTGQKYRFEEIC